LISRGYASRMPNRRYTLGARSLRLASGWIDRLLQVAAAPMTRIANGCGETVYLLQLVGTEAVTLARLPGNRRAVIDVEGGPSYRRGAPAAGRARPGTWRGGRAPSLWPPEPFPAFTPRTKTTWADVNAAINEGRRNGMHAEEGEIDASLSCCAIPLLDGDRDEKLSLAVSFESRRPDSERRAIQHALRRASRQLSWQI